MVELSNESWGERNVIVYPDSGFDPTEINGLVQRAHDLSIPTPRQKSLYENTVDTLRRVIRDEGVEGSVLATAIIEAAEQRGLSAPQAVQAFHDATTTL